MASGSNNAAAVAQLEHAYLRNAVATPLTEAMAQLATLQPDDPIEFLGQYLLTYVDNERRKLETKGPKNEDSGQGSVDVIADDVDPAVVAAQHQAQLLKTLEMQLQASGTSPQTLMQLFLTWTATNLQAEEAYLGRKIVLPASNPTNPGASVVHWIASSRSPKSFVVNRIVGERAEVGVTMQAFEEMEVNNEGSDTTEVAAVDADGNPLPILARIRPFVHIENVLREPKMQFYHVPKLGAYLVRAVAYKHFLHSGVVVPNTTANPDASADTPADTETPVAPSLAPQEAWLAIACDTMGQARAFTPQQLDLFQQSTSLFAHKLEELEQGMVEAEVQRTTETNDAARLDEFRTRWDTATAALEESLPQQLPSDAQDVDKPLLEAQIRVTSLTKLLLEHSPSLSIVASRVVPLPDIAVLIIAVALVLLGHTKSSLWNTVTDTPVWDQLAPLLTEMSLQDDLEHFEPTNALERSKTFGDIQPIAAALTKPEAEAASPIASSWLAWITAVIALSEQERAQAARLAAAQEQAETENAEAT